MPHAPEPTPHDDAPGRLIAALRDAHTPARALPESLTGGILSDYRAARRRRVAARWSVAGAGLAAAAAIALAVVINQPTPAPAPGASRAEALADAIPEDLNADGRVDITDALALARLATSGGRSPAHDLNGDGRIDNADVDVLASRAVRLDRMVLQ